MNLVEVVSGHYGVDVHLETRSENRLEDPKHPRALNGPVKIAGHPAHRVVGIPQAIQRDIDVQLQLRIVFETALGDFINAPRLESIGREIDVANAVLRNEKIDNVFQITTKRGFPATEPQVCQPGHVFRELDDLLPVEISGAIQFIPVEAAVAGGVAVGGDEKDERVQLSTAPRYTSVRLGEMSLYRICRHVMLRVNADRTRLYSNNSAVSGANRI